MTSLSTLHVIGKSIRTTLERGPALVVMFLFLGVTGYLTWNAAAPYGFKARAAVAAVVAILWAAADVIALNTLIDSDTKLKLSSMYLTDYKGIVWTTATLILGAAVFKALLLICAALFILPFLTEGVSLLVMLIRDPYLLTLPQWYVLVVQIQSLLLAVYVATRFMLFPVYVAVESTSFLSGMKQSAAATHGHVSRLAPVMLLAAFSAPAFLVAGPSVEPAVLEAVMRFGSVPYLGELVTGGTYTLFLAVGTVTALSFLATAYSQFK